ncbi:hypothetical protein SAMN02745220_00875 [Desulfopila aestuarii DSM 18488]|uniref:Uncharacterized protein n=2 Tax=Desulfopila aestuarii TaxID=231440 RepID=A0A1M7Y065_9BACT|nr:hypothetical protein SAMN02745220_00875 [Desulfopila aestuarii DSM 18488]
MRFAGNAEWGKLSDYIDSYPWLATAFMGTKVLPEYLAGEREYGLLRLLCNVEEVPPSIIAKLISLGARDLVGRAYLERLLAGVEKGGESTEEQMSGADSPIVAAMVLATTQDPVEVIERMQRVLEQGVQDEDADRRALAERCIGRSQIFYDLQQLLYEHDRIDLLLACLGSKQVLEQMAAGDILSLADVEKALG